MALYSSQFGDLFGIGTARETYENVFSFGRKENGIIIPCIIDKNSTDSGATPTTALRPGLVMGQITATGKYAPYVSTNTDGSQFAVGVLMDAIRMVDLITGNAGDKNVGLLVGGPVQGLKLYGLDTLARGHMFGKFIFDDDMFGNRFEFQQVNQSTAAYTVVPATDRNKHFYATFAGAVTFTLPTTPVLGARFRFTQTLDQNMIITAASKLLVDGNASATSVTYSTASHKIGSCCEVYATQDGTKWQVINIGGTTQTIA